MGVEENNESDDIRISYAEGDQIWGRDVMLGAANGDVSIEATVPGKLSVKISNFNKVLGAYKMYYPGGTAEKIAVTSEAATNKKLSDNVIEVVPLTAATFDFSPIQWMVKVWESRKTYDAGTYNIKVWILNDTGAALNDDAAPTKATEDILMRCRAEAGEYGDATTEYAGMPWIYSDEIDIQIPDPVGSDWDFLQADSVVVDVSGSKIYCEILVSFSDADADEIYIDPQSANP